MKVIVSLVLGAVISTLTAYDVHQSTLTWAPKIIDICLHSDKLRVTYTNLSSTLDRVICFYVHFYQQVLHDILGLPLTRLLLATFGTVYAITAFEGSRKGYRTTTLFFAFPILGFLANLLGISLVFPALWIPLFLYITKDKPPTGDDLSINMPQAYGILLGVIVGYGIPTAIITSPLIKNNSMMEQDLLCLWQVLPVIIVPLFGTVERIFHKIGSPIDQVNEPDLKKKLVLVEGKDAVERCFLFLGLLNVVIYYGTYVFTVHQGIHIWDSILFLLNAPGSLPAGLSFEELGQLLCTRTILVEYISLSISFILWATYNSGIIAGILVTIATPIIGPAAAISFYSYYRENKINYIIAN